MSEESSKRFAALVKRELGARDVHVTAAGSESPEGDLVVALSDGRHVAVAFDAAPADREATLRRLEILVRAFEAVLTDAERPRRRAPAVSLREELSALATRASAVDALVIDAHSPIVWATATHGHEPAVEAPPLPEEAHEVLRLVRESHRGVLTELGRHDEEAHPEPDLDGPWDPPPARSPEVASACERAIVEVRALPQMASLHRGGHLAHSERGESFGWVVRSFAGIYALVLVFDHPFDELRAERAVRDALPRVERLVLALPPMDPDPVPAGVIAMRRRRR